MILRGLGLVTAALASAVLISASAQAEVVTKRSVARGDRTVITTRDEDGRTRTRIVVNRRSFLDPGKQVFPGENRYNDSGPALVYQPTFSGGTDRGTAFDRGQPPLPGRFDLTFPGNPVERP